MAVRMKDIKGYKGRYAITEDGRVWSHSSNRFLKIQCDKRGHHKVVLFDGNGLKNHLIARLVAQAFIPNPDNLPEINHKDENKANNNVSNLEWDSHLEIMRYGSRPANRRAARTYEGKQVYCVELDRVFSSIQEAAITTGRSKWGIGMCCSGKQKTAGRYHWKFVEEVNKK